MAYDTTTVSTGIPFWDMMLSFGKASQQVLSAYAPRPEYAAQAGYVSRSDRGAAHQTTSNVEVIPVGEETLNVGTRRIAGETTRVRRVVVETPVEQPVSLREERVVVERRRPTAASAATTQGILTEAAVEMSDSYEVAEVWKSVRVTEEVVLRREVTERHETVRDTVRRDEVVVEQAKHGIRAPRREIETVQQNRTAAVPAQASTPDAAKLAADLKQVAERFETNSNGHDKAPEASRPETAAVKADQKPATSQPQVQSSKAAAEQPKAPGRSEASGGQNDKGGHGPKT